MSCLRVAWDIFETGVSNVSCAICCGCYRFRKAVDTASARRLPALQSTKTKITTRAPARAQCTSNIGNVQAYSLSFSPSPLHCDSSVRIYLLPCPSIPYQARGHVGRVFFFRAFEVYVWLCCAEHFGTPTCTKGYTDSRKLPCRPLSQSEQLHCDRCVHSPHPTSGLTFFRPRRASCLFSSTFV